MLEVYLITKNNYKKIHKMFREFNNNNGIEKLIYYFIVINPW